MAAHQIGTLVFLEIEGHLMVPQNFTEVLRRDNVDGVVIRRGGKWAEPSIVRTRVDVNSLTAGVNLKDTYTALINAGPQKFIQNNVDYDSIATPLKVQVLHVDVADPYAVRCIVGGTIVSGGGAGAIVEAAWTLQPV